MIRVYLEQEGYRIIEAANGRDALFTARHEKPDLIILDLM
ncbi:MAG: DNA-binding response regulator, partial [Chloroflexi bacterium]|nr:DNA-binding response regulator [Chloroflexota bacterium]